MRFGLSISASTATKVGRISPVAARARECPLTETDSGGSAGRRDWSSCPICVIRPVARPSQVCETGHFLDFRASCSARVPQTQ